MSGIILPAPHHEQSPRWKAPQRNDRHIEREIQLTKQRALRERLRYRRYAQSGSLGSFMQALGDFGRQYFPFIGHGWNGMGGRS